MDLSISARTVNGVAPVCVVALSGEFDIASSGALREAFYDLYQDGHRTVVLDLREVTFCDSTGLGAIATHAKLLLDHGGSLVLAAAQPSVANIFQIAGLTKVLSVTSTVDEALANGNHKAR